MNVVVGNVYARSSRVAFLRHRYYARFSTATFIKNKHPPPALKQYIANNADQYYYSLRCFASTTEGFNNTPTNDDDDKEDWMPPDDSPLVANNSNNNTTFNLPHNNITLMSPEEMEGINEDEIEVIDLEATLNNPQNQQFLSSQEEIDDETAHDVSPSEFDVESNDVGWKEVLKEMRDAGKTDIMDRLVHEYKLQRYLDALDDDDDNVADDIEESSGISTANKSVSAASVDNDEEEWDEEFEASLEGLTIDEVIDELIENSPSLSQLEMEILSQEFDKAERGEGEGIHIDSLEDDNVDLNYNTNYMEFRAMVLSDYYKKKKKDKRDPIAHLPTIPPPRTNWSTKSDFVDYPPDWKDYDSKAAFKKDFVDADDDTWVPPSSQFVPSRNDAKEEREKKDKSTTTNDLDGTIDWLQARRSRLGESTTDGGKKPTHLLTPDQAETFRNQNSQIEIIPHTLFTTMELTTSLSAQGATDIHIIDTSKLKKVHGVGIGCNYIMLATGRNASHIRVLADSVVRNLKARKLNERNVVGASLGAEGGEDIFSNKRNRNRARRNGATNTSGKVDDDWMVVDCENIHVHIMEESTRRCLNIEGLFDTHPNSDGSLLRSLDLDDEEAIDTYVANNPIPDEYAAKIFNIGGKRSDSWISGEKGRVFAVPAQNKSFSARWSGTSSNGKKKRSGKR